MMKKILNWTFGSVFRTFGRILAYLLIALVGFIIIQKRDLKITDLFGIITVKADVKQSWANSQSRYRFDDHGTNTYSSWETTPHTWQPTLPVNKMQWRVKTTGGLSYENTYIIKFAYKPIPQAITPTKIQIYADSGTVEYEEISCSQWKYNDDGFNVVQCSFTPKDTINANTWLIIEVNFTSGYLTSIRSYMNNYEERTGTNAVITQQTNEIINQNNENTQEIINQLQESATKTNDKLNEVMQSQNVCKNLSISEATLDGYIAWNGEFHEQYGSNKSTNFINIQNVNSIILLKKANTNKYACFYDIEKTMIRCDDTSTLNAGHKFNIPPNSVYFRSNFEISDNLPVYNICSNGNQAVNDSLNDLIHDINNKDTEEAFNYYKDFFNLFTNNGHGLTSIITAPLNAINSLTSSTCSPLVLPLPYMEDKNITLPCMRSIYEEYFGSFMLIYDTITFGIISYWVILKLFKLIKNFKNPEDESIEVVDL